MIELDGDFRRERRFQLRPATAPGSLTSSPAYKMGNGFPSASTAAGASGAAFTRLVMICFRGRRVSSNRRRAILKTLQSHWQRLSMNFGARDSIRDVALLNGGPNACCALR